MYALDVVTSSDAVEWLCHYPLLQFWPLFWLFLSSLMRSTSFSYYSYLRLRDQSLNHPIAVSNPRRCLLPISYRRHQTDSQILFFFLSCVRVFVKSRAWYFQLLRIFLVSKFDPSAPSVLLFRPMRLRINKIWNIGTTSVWCADCVKSAKLPSDLSLLQLMGLINHFIYSVIYLWATDRNDQLSKKPWDLPLRSRWKWSTIWNTL